MSYTTELAKVPERSFIRTVLELLDRNEYVGVHMGHFRAQDRPPLEVCRDNVRGCAIYIGVIGFRYGSVVDNGHVSYTEDEFLTAGEAGIRRLIFMLKDPLSGPHLTDPDMSAILAFRRRLKRSGVYVAWFDNPDNLASLVLQALVAESPRPWQLPPMPDQLVLRPEIVQPVVGALASGKDGAIAGIFGAGGFGKSTAAALACASGEVRRAYPGGMVWANLPDSSRPQQLAGLIGDICYQLSGVAYPFASEEQAGHRLGQLLDQRPRTLLVLDDLSSRQQLLPFSFGGAKAGRLITTRQGTLLPKDAAQTRVEELDQEQEHSLLMADLAGIPATTAAELRAQTKGWVLLDGLANAYLRYQVARGFDGNESARVLADALRVEGPGTSALVDVVDRDPSATIESNLSLLTKRERDRYLELAIFPEDGDIPFDVVTLLWAHTGRMGSDASRRLVEKLAALCLVTGHQPGRPASGVAFRLHDVLRAYIRITRSRSLVATHTKLLDAAAGLLGQRQRTKRRGRPWWNLPDDHGYLWRHLAYHLDGAGLVEELAATATDLRWIEERTRRSGVTDAQADLAVLGHRGGSGAADLSRALSGAAHLLDPVTPERSHADILVSRLAPLQTLAPFVVDLESRRPPDWRPPTGTRLTNLVPPPDVNSALVRVIRGHTDAVTGVAIAPTGTWLASTSGDGTVRLWEVDGRPRAVLTEHGRRTNAAAVCADGSWFATADDAGSVRIWGADGTPRAVLPGHTAAVNALAIARDGTWLVSVGNDTTARVWSPNGASLSDPCRHGKAVNAVSIAPDEDWFVTVSDDGTIRTWSAAGEPLHRSRHDASLNGVTVLPGGEIVTAGSGLHRWSRTLDTCVSIVADAQINTLSSGRNGAWLGVTGNDTVARVFAADGTPVSTFPGHSRRVTDIAVAPDGGWLATASEDGTLRLWRADDTGGASTADTTAMNAMALAPAGDWLVTASRDQPTRIWDADGRPLASLPGTPDGPTRIAISPDSSWFATSSNATVRRWRRDGTSLRELPGKSGRRVSGLAISPNGATLVVARSHEKAVERFVAGTGGSPGVVIAPHGKWLATSGNQRVDIWDLDSDSGPRRVVSVEPLAAPRSSALRPHTVVRLLQLDGESHAPLIGHDDRVTGLAVSPVGDWLASTGADLTLRLWQGDGQPISTIDGHTGLVVAMAIAPDGKWLATAGQDGRLGLWRRDSGPIVEPIQHDAPLTGVAISPDGTFVAVTADDGTAVVWSPAGDRLAVMRADVPLHLPILHENRLYFGGFGLFAFIIEGGSPR